MGSERTGEAGGRWWRRHDGGPRTRAVVMTGGVIAVVLAPFGVAATGDVLREGARNGTAKRETQIVASLPATTTKTGGFTVIDGYATNANVYVDAGASMAGHGLSATIAIQNAVDTDGDGTAEPSFGGEVGGARCQTAAVSCAPTGAQNAAAFVVSPRNSDGSATAGTAANPRRRVYVTITE